MIAIAQLCFGGDKATTTSQCCESKSADAGRQPGLARVLVYCAVPHSKPARNGIAAVVFRERRESVRETR